MADNARQNTTFASNGGEAHGYLSLPAGGSGPGVIVIQEWWGLVDHIAEVTDRFAAEGFVALAPDLYGGTTTHDADEAGKLMQELPVEQAAKDLRGAVDFLLGHDAVTAEAVGTVGFCMGGGFVLVLAAQAGDAVAAAVPFYAVLDPDPDLSGITAPVLGHFGGADDFVPPDRVDQLEAKIRDQAGVPVTFHRYEGRGHAFFNDANAFGTYNADDAALAWSRTVDFLRTNLS
ncbi:dienelactone hydrolase family protein [soil metagenome]